MASRSTDVRCFSSYDVQKIFNHDLGQWNTFMLITLKIAKALAREHPTRTWFRVPAKEKADILIRLNEMLQKEGVPSVCEVVFKWRMAGAVSNSLRQIRGEKQRAEQKAAKVQVVSKALDPMEKRDEKGNEKRRMFDPIRDI